MPAPAFGQPAKGCWGIEKEELPEKTPPVEPLQKALEPLQKALEPLQKALEPLQKAWNRYTPKRPPETSHFLGPSCLQGRFSGSHG